LRKMGVRSAVELASVIVSTKVKPLR